MTKNEKRVLIVDMIVLVVFSVLAFAIPFTKNPVFVLSYIWGVFAVLIQIYVLKIAFGKEAARSKFYGFPIARVGIIYMVVQLVLSIVFMALAMICPIQVPIILYVIALALATVGLIAADATRDEIEKIDIKQEEDVSLMQELRSIVYPLAGQTEDEELKKTLQNLADKFKYSDPVSSEAIKNIEIEIKVLVEELQRAVLEEETQVVVDLSKKISIILTERNRLCKLNK